MAKKLSRVDSLAIAGEFRDCIQEGESPAITQRVGLTVFGYVFPPASYMQTGAREEAVALLRERSHIIPGRPGWRERMDFSRPYAPTVEWCEEDVPGPNAYSRDARVDILREAMRNQLGVALEQVQKRMKLLFTGREYKFGMESLPYHATHYALLLRSRSDMKWLLESIRLPVTAGTLHFFDEKEGERKHGMHISPEIDDVLQAGFELLRSKKNKKRGR